MIIKIEKKENYNDNLSSYCNSWLQFRHTPDEKAFENSDLTIGEALNNCNSLCTCNKQYCIGRNNPVLNPRLTYDSDSC